MFKRQSSADINRGLASDELQNRLTLGLVCLFSVGYFLFLNHLSLFSVRPYADEHILLGVSQRLFAESSLDTNWALVDEIYRRYPNQQYNFSAAILAYSGLGWLLQPFIVRPGDTGVGIFDLRAAANLFASLSIVIFYLSLSKLAKPTIAAFSTIGAAITYQMVTDGMVARPEGFMFFCYAAGLLATSHAITRDGTGRAIALVVAGVMTGLLVATKFSMIFCGAQFALLYLVSRLQLKTSGFEDFPTGLIAFALNNTGLAAATMIPGCLMGIFIGAPHAVLDPAAALDGISFLLGQYDNPHLPYGRAELDIFGRWGHGLSQFISFSGFAILIMVLAGLAVMVWRRHFALLALVGTSCLLMLYFLQTPVFFARNYSMVIPVVFLSAFFAISETAKIFRSRRWETASIGLVSTLLLIQPAAATIEITRGIKMVDQHVEEMYAISEFYAHQADLEIVEANAWLNAAQNAAFLRRANDTGPAFYRFWSQNDPYSQSRVDEFVRLHGFKLVYHHKGQLSEFPQSMIHFNFDRSEFLLSKGLSESQADGWLDILSLHNTCVGVPLDFNISGTFLQTGFHESSTAPASLGASFGSWINGDAARGQTEIEIVGPPGSQFILPIYTGPGVGGQSIEIMMPAIASHRRFPVFTDEVWLGLVLELDPDGRLRVKVEDAGDGWGQWMAVGRPRAFQDCDEGGTRLIGRTAQAPKARLIAG